MSDLIKRESAIRAFGEDWTWLERNGVYTLTMAEAKQRAADLLESIPAINPFQVVLDELSKCGLFTGKYDAKNGKEDFMYGVLTVMEQIAYSISGEAGYKFSDLFMNNMVESEKRAAQTEKTIETLDMAR